LFQWLSLQILSLLHRETPVQKAVEMLQNTHDHASLAVQVFFAVAIAPVAEEVLFRGVMYASIKRLDAAEITAVGRELHLEFQRRGFPRIAWFCSLPFRAVVRVGLPRIALWSSSVLFAAIHLSLPVFLPLVALAVALALLYEYTDNLLAPITAHAVFNAVNLLAFFGWFPHWFS
jgi:membrane protease YdiL (CAAX protease family)